MTMVSQDYTEGDEHKILDLFSEVFGKEMSLKVWKWRFVENPFGRGIIKLLFDKGKLIGHYAIIPMKVKVSDGVIDAAFSMTTMTHPDYRGRGIFPLLGEETYQEANRKGIKFVFGFPNQNSYDGFVKKLNWLGFGTMNVWQRDFERQSSFIHTQDESVQEIDEFDDTVNSLWAEVEKNYTIIVPRTRDFLNWRFVRIPDVSYTKYVYKDGEDKISGYIILKIHRSESETKGHIIDMLSIPDERVVNALLRRTYSFFIEREILDASCWFPEKCFCADMLRKDGFSIARMERTFFGVRIFDKTDMSLKFVKDFPNWYLTMGDSDVF
jgi:predicted acetyltransferase